MAIEGSLQSVDIQDIVQLLNLNRSTGLLHIIDASLKGVLFYRDGEIINASAEGLTGEAAAYMLLAKSTGHFNFEISDHSAERQIQRTIHDLVLETARRKDTIGKIRGSIKHDNIVFLPLVDVRIPAARKEFNEYELQLLSQLDGQTEIKNIIDKKKENAFEIFHVIYDLEVRGFLKRVDIYKILEVTAIKKLFGKATEAIVPQHIIDEWVSQSMTYADCEAIEIRTQQNTFGQIPLAPKATAPDGIIQIPKHIMAEFEVSEGDKVLIKPLVNPG